MAEASNVFELLQCGILLAYWVWDSTSIQVEFGLYAMWFACG